jgi:Zn-dependent peptidase ImmA (M78 family)
VTPPFDVRGIADQIGVVVRDVPSPGWDGAVRSNATSAIVWLNADHPEARRRFTLAHELGHLLLHPTGEMFRDSESQLAAPDRREVEANKFAAALLMPISVLEPIVVGPRPRTAAQLAALFQVSVEAMGYQIEKLR